MEDIKFYINLVKMLVSFVHVYLTNNLPNDRIRKGNWVTTDDHIVDRSAVNPPSFRFINQSSERVRN